MVIGHNRRSRARARRHTLFATALAAGLLIPLVPAAAQAAPATGAPTCQMIALPTPEGTVSSVNGADPTGRYMVGDASTGYPDYVFTGLLWKNGRLTEIDASSLQHVMLSMEDVNRHGVAVGERTTDYGSFHKDAFIYRDGRFTMLPAPIQGASTDAVAINSRGDVVGNVTGAVVVWPANRPGTVRVLTQPDGWTNATATDVDEDGTVVGYVGGFPPGTPYVWPAVGTPHPLPIPAGSEGGTADAIRLGMVAGNVFPPPTGPVNATAPTLWNLRTGSFTIRSDVAAGAFSVNRWGTIGGGGAIIHADGRVVPILSGAFVNAMTDRGVGAGTTTYAMGQAVIWTGC